MNLFASLFFEHRIITLNPHLLGGDYIAQIVCTIGYLLYQILPHFKALNILEHEPKPSRAKLAQQTGVDGTPSRGKQAQLAA